jgi:hypothetical protein
MRNATIYYSQATINSSDLSLAIYCSCSQSCDTIPLMTEDNFRAIFLVLLLWNPLNPTYKLRSGVECVAQYSHTTAT